MRKSRLVAASSVHAMPWFQDAIKPVRRGKEINDEQSKAWMKRKEIMSKKQQSRERTQESEEGEGNESHAHNAKLTMVVSVYSRHDQIKHTPNSSNKT